MANALSWPAATCGIDEFTCAKPNCECPATRPVTCRSGAAIGDMGEIEAEPVVEQKTEKCDGVPGLYDE